MATLQHIIAIIITHLNEQGSKIFLFVEGESCSLDKKIAIFEKPLYVWLMQKCLSKGDLKILASFKITVLSVFFKHGILWKTCSCLFTITIV